MRIASSSIENITTSGASYIDGSAPESRGANGTGPGSRSDTVSLSNATNLLALAKSGSPVNGQAKLESITAQIRSGAYQADTVQLSHSLVQGHIQG